MPDAVFSLEYDSEEKLFAEWGMSRIKRTVGADGTDYFAFDLEDVSIEDAPAFPARSEIIVRRDGVVWFRGIRIKNPRTGSIALDKHDFVFSGPMWFLEKCIFQQQWKGSDGAGVITSAPTPHLFLQQTLAGAKQTTEDQVVEVIDWVRARCLAEFGVHKLQADAGGYPAVDAPIDEVMNITCAEAIERCQRWAPDAVRWWDYSTTPPTFKMQRRADLAAVTVPLGDGARLDEITLADREDNAVPAVVFTFRQTAQIDGETVVRHYLDVAPPGATGLEFGALVNAFEFDGGSRTTGRATIVSEAYAPTTVAWWKKKLPWLNSKDLANITLVSGTGEIIAPDDLGEDFTLELLNGNVADWMTAYGVVEKTITVKATMEQWDRDVSGGTSGAIKLRGPYEEKLTVRIRATDAPSGTYESVLSESDPEPLPFGLAAQVLASLSDPQWEGALLLTENEVTGDVAIGTVLNVSGGDADWSTMRALLQSVEYDLSDGATRADFGPAPMLGAGDLIALSRVGRFRQIRTALTSRTAASGSSGALDIGSQVPRENSSSHTGANSAQRYIPDPSSPTAATQFIEAKAVADDLQHQLQGASTRFALRKVTNTTITDELTTASGRKVKATVDASNAKIEITNGTYSVLVREDKIEIVDSAGGGASIKLNLADCGGKALQVREIDVCEGGVAKKLRLLCSTTY